jgi:hypothetical protein
MRSLISLLAGLALWAFASPALAQNSRRAQKAPKAHPALDEVQRARKARGLRPFVEDKALTRAAMAAARYRAKRLIQGHTSDNFAFVPRGATARAAGCAAWERSWGWGSCCTYDRYKYAGAAWARGRDGRRYMHLYVR